MGDYFFGLGSFSDFSSEKHFGLLTKFSNSGDTIWTRKYQYSIDDTSNVKHTLHNIYEYEDGKILALGEIGREDYKNEIWLLELDSLGCMNDIACNEIGTFISFLSN